MEQQRDANANKEEHQQVNGSSETQHETSF